MKMFKATYSMGGIATGGFFKSLVVAHKQENVEGVLNETHGEDISNLKIVAAGSAPPNYYKHEEVISTESD